MKEERGTRERLPARKGEKERERGRESAPKATSTVAASKAAFAHVPPPRARAGEPVAAATDADGRATDWRASAQLRVKAQGGRVLVWREERVFLSTTKRARRTK